MPQTKTHLCLPQYPDVDNTSSIDLLAAKRGHSIMCFDAVAAFGHAPERELIFIEAPAEHRGKVGQHVLWQCLKVREGRRKGARAWQDHFVDILLSKECPANFKQSLKPRSNLFYSSEFEIALGLHVDDGYVTGPAEKHEEGVRISRDQNCAEILAHHQRRKLVRACWSSDGDRRRRPVGERPGQV